MKKYLCTKFSFVWEDNEEHPILYEYNTKKKKWYAREHAWPWQAKGNNTGSYEYSDYIELTGPVNEKLNYLLDNPEMAVLYLQDISDAVVAYAREILKCL